MKKKIISFFTAAAFTFQFSAFFMNNTVNVKAREKYERCYIKVTEDTSKDEYDPENCSLTEALISNDTIYVPLSNNAVWTNAEISIKEYSPAMFSLSQQASWVYSGDSSNKNLIDRILSPGIPEIVDEDLLNFYNAFLKFSDLDNTGNNSAASTLAETTKNLIDDFSESSTVSYEISKNVGTKIKYYIKEDSSEIFVYNGRKCCIEDLGMKVIKAKDNNGEKLLWVPVQQFLSYLNADFYVSPNESLHIEKAEHDIREIVNSKEIFNYYYDVVNDACYSEDCYNWYNRYHGLKAVYKGVFSPQGVIGGINEICGSITEEECQNVADILCRTSTDQQSAASVYLQENAGDINGMIYTYLSDEINNGLDEALGSADYILEEIKKGTYGTKPEHLLSEAEVKTIIKNTENYSKLSDSAGEELAKKLDEYIRDEAIISQSTAQAQNKVKMFETNTKVLGLQFDLIATSLNAFKTASDINSGNKVYCEAFTDLLNSCEDPSNPEINDGVSERIETLSGEWQNAVTDISKDYLKCFDDYIYNEVKDKSLDLISKKLKMFPSSAAFNSFCFKLALIGYAADFTEFALNKITGFTDYNVAMRHMVYLSSIQDDSYKLLRSERNRLGYDPSGQNKWENVRNHAVAALRSSDVTLRQASFAYEAMSKSAGKNKARLLDNSETALRIAGDASVLEYKIMYADLPGEKMNSVYTDLIDSGCIVQEISMQVTDMDDNPLQDVSVYISTDETPYYFETDAEGNITSGSGKCCIPFGKYKCMAMKSGFKPGYDPEKDYIEVTSAGPCDMGIIKLEKDDLQFGTVLRDTEKLYYRANTSDANNLYEYDPVSKTETVLQEIKGSSQKNLVYSGGNIIYASNEGLCSYNTVSGENSVLISDNSINIAGLTEDGNIILESGYSSDRKIYLYNLSDNSLTLKAEGSFSFLCINDDRMYLAYCDGFEYNKTKVSNYEIKEYSLSTDTERLITTQSFEIYPMGGNAIPQKSTVIGDSLIIFYSQPMGGNGGALDIYLYEISISDGQQNLLSRCGSNNSSSLFDYDNETLCYLKTDNAEGTLYIYNVLTKEEKSCRVNSKAGDIVLISGDSVLFTNDIISADDMIIKDVLKESDYLSESSNGYCSYSVIGKTDDKFLVSVYIYEYDPSEPACHANNYGYRLKNIVHEVIDIN